MNEQERQELNRRIAVEIMGWQKHLTRGDRWLWRNPRTGATYSSEISLLDWHGMGLIVERMRELAWHYNLEDIGDIHKAIFTKWDAEPFNCYVERHTNAPQAIAQAALKARKAEAEVLAALDKGGHHP